MKMLDVICTAESCKAVQIDVLIRDYDWKTEAKPELPPCPACGAPTERVYLPQSSANVHGDDIPGGVYIKHGLCHPDGTPRRFDSWSAVRKAAAAKGMTNYVNHTTEPGTDKSKHTSRWV